jgi:hypothetical protein
LGNNILDSYSVGGLLSWAMSLYRYKPLDIKSGPNG